MNSKTTLLLAALLAGLVLGYYGLRRQAPAEPSASTAPSAKTEPSVTRDLLTEPLGNVVKVVAKRGNDEWIFEKKPSADGGPAAWHMTKPTEAKVLTQEVDRIVREAGKIQYEISYNPGEGAISAADAGLSPPASTISLTDDAGKSATIEIGKPASENETYARKAGDEAIVVAKSNLRKLLKAKALEYRDLQLWNFVVENVTRAEICETTASPEGKPVCYRFARDGTRWMMEQPVSAKATGKVDEMLRAVSRLRVSQWQGDDASKLKVYGLDPGALQIKLTVEEPVPAEKKDETKSDGDEAESPPAPPEKRVKQYNLQVADRGPIGEDTKVFVRSGDESAVATIFKSAADKFKPVMSEWREMQVTSADVTKANRIELNAGGKSTTLVQKEDQWIFEVDSAPAESHAVTELLAGIKGLKAVSFVEGPDAGPAPSFDSPQADIRLTIPGVEGIERITVGGYTDPAKKLLVYVRRGDAGPIAKVKASEALALIKPPAALRDRTVLSFPSDGLKQISIERPAEFLPGYRQKLEFHKENNEWKMMSPTSGLVRVDEVTKLTTSLSDLKAESIVGEAEETTAFGLHDPTVIVQLVVADPNSAPENPYSSAFSGGRPFELLLAEHDGKIYAKHRNAGPIYEVNRAFFDQLRVEFRSGEAFEFEPKDVERVTLKAGEEVNSFVRKAGKWVLEAEPDLPIDSAKVDKILTEAKALKSDRYASYSSDQLAPYGLEQPHFKLLLILNNQAQPGEKSITLRVSEKSVNYQSQAQPAPAAETARPSAPASTTATFATLSGHDGVFLLGSDAVRKIFIPLAELEKK